MKIAVFDNSLHGSGARRAFFELVKGLSERGHHIDLYIFSGYKEKLFPISRMVKEKFVFPIKELSTANMKFYLLEQCINFFRFIFYLPILKKGSYDIACKINGGGYDVAFLNVCDIMRAPYLLRYLKIPTVYFCHHPNREAFEPIYLISRKGEYENQNKIKTMYRNLCAWVTYSRAKFIARAAIKNARCATIVLANSYYAREYIYKAYGVLGKVNYLGIDSAMFRPLGLKKKNFILSVGGIDPVKRFDDVINALSYVPEGQRPSFTIVASRSIHTTYQRNLINLAQRKNVDLTIVRDISDEQLAHLYNEAFMVVFVPLMEPFGFVPLEAMACGTPVIGVREGGVRETIQDGETGLLVDRDMKELAQAIRLLVSDSGLRQRLSAEGRLCVEKEWTWKKSIDTLEQHLHEAIGKASEPAKQRPKKVMLLVDLAYSPFGGAEKQIFELARNIDRDKYELIVGCLSKKDNLLSQIREGGVKTITFHVKYIYDLFGIKQGIAFKNFLKKENVDILVTYHFGSDVWGAVFGRLAGVPVIISSRRDEGYWRKKIHTLTYRLINRWYKKILVNSQAVKRMVLEKDKAPGHKVQLIYNGIDLERFQGAMDRAGTKEKLGFPQDSYLVGCVGNLRPVKGHTYLIKAAQQVIKVFPKAHFVFIGIGESKESLATEAKDAGIENNIHFLGIKKDIPAMLAIMDICALPSLSEGFSNALLEYMAAGKPIVATAVGGNVDVIEHEKNGLLVPPKDPQALAEAVIRLLKEKEFAAALAANARKTVEERFDMKKQIREFEQFLESVGERGNNLNAKPYTLNAKKQLKIMHLISSNGLFGAEKVMLALASNLNNNGTQSIVAGVRNRHNPHVEALDAAQKASIPTCIVESSGRFDFGAALRIRRCMQDNKIDIVHTHNYKSNILGVLAARTLGIPIVATVHGYINGDAKLKLYGVLDRFVLKFFDKVVVVDESQGRVFNGKCTVINNGVETNDVTRSPGHQVTRQQLGIGEDEMVIGSVGRLSPEKNHELLIDAFAHIDNSRCRLLMVGDGPLRQRLADSVKRLGLEGKVIFTGYQDARHYYPIIDIYVSSSLIEHFPVSILEAMSFGKAVIATGVGGTPQLVKDEETGLLIDSRNSNQLARALERLLGDTPLRLKLRESAKKYVAEKYSVEKMVSEYRSVYEEALK